MADVIAQLLATDAARDKLGRRGISTTEADYCSSGAPTAGVCSRW